MFQTKTQLFDILSGYFNIFFKNSCRQSVILLVVNKVINFEFMKELMVNLNRSVVFYRVHPASVFTTWRSGLHSRKKMFHRWVGTRRWGWDRHTQWQRHKHQDKQTSRHTSRQTSRHTNIKTNNCLSLHLSVSLRFSPWCSPGGRGSSGASGSVSALVTWVQHQLQHAVRRIPWGRGRHLSGNHSPRLTLWSRPP